MEVFYNLISTDNSYALLGNPIMRSPNGFWSYFSFSCFRFTRHYQNCIYIVKVARLPLLQQSTLFNLDVTTYGSVFTPQLSQSPISSFYCLNVFTGAQIWNYTIDSYVYTPLAVVDGFVYTGALHGVPYAHLMLYWDANMELHNRKHR